MFSKIRKRFTYANLVLTLALVFAMSGGAYAASKYVITSTKQISPKVLKSLKGANGKSGTNGTNGAAGPAGPAGPTGPAGGTGPAGTNGNNGTNGTNGENGREGSPWTAKGTLPKGSSETGTWSYSLTATGSGASLVLVPISFPIPLPEALEEAQVHYIKPGQEGVEFPAECPGSVAEPKATEGNLCVYTGTLGGVSVVQIEPPEAFLKPSGGFGSAPEDKGADTSGTLMQFPSAEHKLGFGAWAVKAK
jgi:hypothetical protein